MTPTPTGLDGLVGTVAIVLWDVGPALARDALDHRDWIRRRRWRRWPARTRAGGNRSPGPKIGAPTPATRPDRTGAMPPVVAMMRTGRVLSVPHALGRRIARS